MSENTLYLIGGLAILGSALVGGYLPLLLRGRTQAVVWFSFGNAFAGGVFLGAGLLHMLPHAAETFSHLAHEAAGSHVHAFPWAFAFATFGMLLILLAEKVIPARRDFDEPRMVGRALADARPGHAAHGHAAVGNSAHPIVLLLALSIHAYFAGLAFGSEASGAAAMAILVAILGHKLAESFALGITLAGSSYSASTIRKLILIFACVTPFGVLCGVMLNSTGGSHVVMMGAILNSIAAGTFIYIATMDIINEEFTYPEHRWTKFGCLLAGLFLMVLLMQAPH